MFPAKATVYCGAKNSEKSETQEERVLIRELREISLYIPDGSRERSRGGGRQLANQEDAAAVSGFSRGLSETLTVTRGSQKRDADQFTRRVFTWSDKMTRRNRKTKEGAGVLEKLGHVPRPREKEKKEAGESINFASGIGFFIMLEALQLVFFYYFVFCL